MSRLSRFLPKFLRSGKDVGKPSVDKSQCKIIFLDETEFYLQYKGGLKGQYVLDKAYEQLNLFEKDYFGLRFIDSTGQTHWLDVVKTLSSQLKGCNIPYTFYFGVKFYPADPCKLKEEITRYQFFLQVKRDILHGRLPVSFEEAAELFAYAVQSELGDYESQQLAAGYVSEFHFVPNQTEELEAQIVHLHRRLGGTVPATAELKFLDKVKWQDMYGVDLHPVMGEGNTEYFLGLTPTGIVVYKNKTKVGNYFWPRITKVNCKGKVFVVRVKDKINDEHTYAFELATKAGCKHLWKCCVEHHAFFRLNQLGSTPRSSKPFRSTSKHRNSGRQDRQNNTDHFGREQPRVLRVQSRRQARRAMSDPRLNQGDMVSGIQYTEGHVTMVVKPEQLRGPRHRSLPDLKGRESPTSTRSAPWETNMDTGLYTSGRESPISVTQSENVNHMRRHRDSDSEGGGYRRKSYRQGYDSDGGGSRYKYFPSSRKGSDNESDVSFTRRRRRDHDSGSESDISPKLTARQRKTKSVGADRFEKEWQVAMQGMYMADKENRQNGSAPSLHSAPAGESRQKKMRRRRSKSPGNKRPPDELRNYIEFDMLEPSEEFTEEQLREIPYVNVETKAEPFKVKYSPSNRRRYRSPKRKSATDLDSNGRGGYVSEDAPPPYTRTPERTPEPTHRQVTSVGGYYSDSGSLPRRNQPMSPYTQQQQYNNSLVSHSKPIDNTDDRGSNHTDQSHSNSSTHDMDNRHLHSDHLDDLQQGQADLGQGQGLDDDDRNHDSGLNSSHSSGGPAAMTPNMARGGAGRMYGTQDAIARLYSSPAGTRRHQSQNTNQSMNSTNQNSSYSRSGSGLANQGRTYTSVTPNRMQTGSQAVVHSSGTMDRTQSTNYRSQAIPAYDNHVYNHNSMQPPDHRHTSSNRENIHNGYIAHSAQNGIPSDISSNKAMYSQSDSRPNTHHMDGLQQPQNHLQYNRTNNQTYGPGGHNYRQPRGQMSGNMSSAHNGGTFYNQPNPPPHYSSPGDRLGVQPSWQYVGNTRTPVNQSSRAQSAGHVQQNGTENSSPYSQSPASSPVKRTRQTEQGTNTVSTNQRTSSSHVTSMTPPNIRSPDSAISSLASLSVSNSNRNSPRKQSRPETKGDSPSKGMNNNVNNNVSNSVNNNVSNSVNNNTSSQEDKMKDGFSRKRMPAFGRSDIWTEL